ncbi:MAG: YaaR family protein [Spirochaetales bacterium]|nr:YaaR family protein [Spirochaetales bacterium]
MQRLGSLGADYSFKKSLRKDKDVKKSKSSPSVFKTLLEPQTVTASAVSAIGGFDEESELEDLLDDVHQRGDELLRNKDMSSIEDYKKAVRNFIHYVVQEAMKVETIDGAKFSRFKPSNKQKRYTLISVIDDKLDKLAAGILLNQGKQLDLLSKVEEINGLLVDLVS